MEHVTDTYVKRAQADGMRSRAAYKLEQIVEKDHLLKPGMLVVDLGAAPGSWAQVAAQVVGQRGRVVAVDLLDVAPIANVTTIRGDFSENAVFRAVEAELKGSQADLVLSDMAPNISGIALVDQARGMALAELALEFAQKHLKPQGNFLVKSFHGVGFDAFVVAMRRVFVRVAVRKPDASRSRSNEVYLLGAGLKAGN